MLNSGRLSSLDDQYSPTSRVLYVTSPVISVYKSSPYISYIHI